METEFTLSRLAEIARVPKRAVQLWADAGVVKADPSTMLAGSGVHRRFNRDELIVACIVAPFAKQKIAIGGLQVISDGVRGLLLMRRKHRDRNMFAIFDRAIAGSGSNYLLAYWVERKNGELHISDIAPVTDENSQIINFFEQMNLAGSDKKPVRVDVIALNEALKDIPA